MPWDPSDHSCNNRNKRMDLLRRKSLGDVVVFVFLFVVVVVVVVVVLTTEANEKFIAKSIKLY